MSCGSESITAPVFTGSVSTRMASGSAVSRCSGRVSGRRSGMTGRNASLTVTSASRPGGARRPTSGCGSCSARPNWPTSAPRQIAQIISAEAGKTITEARGEASRSGDLIRLAAFEGTQLYGDSLPLDANRGTGLDKIGFTVRQPVGVVVAITPFNYPALLVMHKLAPALAAGNAVVLKPARTTPLTALALARCFVDAGLPDGVLSVLTGPGGSSATPWSPTRGCARSRSPGRPPSVSSITRIAGIKKLSLELGASCPVVVLPDADIELAASAVAAGGYINAGPGLHLGAAGHHPPDRRRGLPRRAGAQGGGDQDR